ncbi:MAG: hypothetical protein AMXMBFR7_34820 [Planctomycetota bacterium]
MAASEAVFDPELLPGQLPLPLDWALIFGRRAPLGVEIGSGGGRFVIGEAERHPEMDWLGIETAGHYFYTMKERVAKRRLPNLKVVRTDGADLVASCFPDASVSAYHIYFPDPWPKARHRKRRLIKPAFVQQLKRTLAPEGVLYFATDHRDYCEEAEPVLRAELDVTPHPEPWPDAPRGRTNFEAKYMIAGRPIYRFIARRRA